MGVKPLYCRQLVDLALELHIAPQFLHAQMFRLRLITPQMTRLWERYGSHPARLRRDVERLRGMRGYGREEEFFSGVTVQTTFERDWMPVEEGAAFTPVMLTMVLNLYFQLTPVTMVPSTPEVAALAKLMKVSPEDIIRVLDTFLHIDPYIRREASEPCFLEAACREVWAKWGNNDPEKLYQLADQLKRYFLS